LLKQLGSRLEGELRSSDVLARLGGDEFGVLLVGCELEKARAIAENLLRTVAEFQFVWENSTFNVGVSIGMVAGDRESESVTDLLTAADVACYIFGWWTKKTALFHRVLSFQRPNDLV